RDADGRPLAARRGAPGAEGSRSVERRAGCDARGGRGGAGEPAGRERLGARVDGIRALVAAARRSGAPRGASSGLGGGGIGGGARSTWRPTTATRSIGSGSRSRKRRAGGWTRRARPLPRSTRRR